ncbi:hypothetical protein DH2020_046367 [Rehmannia glutinosa]|uniref:Uncharacterized protein n=1 Tax=Rehmannia glutinosa TaxID=99300 RepID=A0ABR0UBH4_REHGL
MGIAPPPRHASLPAAPPVSATIVARRQPIGSWGCHSPSPLPPHLHLNYPSTIFSTLIRGVLPLPVPPASESEPYSKPEYQPESLRHLSCSKRQPQAPNRIRIREPTRFQPQSLRLGVHILLNVDLSNHVNLVKGNDSQAATASSGKGAVSSSVGAGEHSGDACGVAEEGDRAGRRRL